MQRRPDQTGQTPQHHDIATEHTAILPSTSGPQQPPISGDLPPVPIAPPAMRPDGGLTTYIGEPGQALHTADAAHAAQERAQRDVSALAGSLAELAAQLHEHARHLEQFVEGSLSTDLADPRTHLLSRSLELTRQADLRLARLGETLRHLTESVRAAQSNLDALRQERERLSTLYSIAQDLNTSLDLEDVLGQVMARLIEVVHAERGFLMLWDEAAGTLQFRAARGADGRTLAEDDFNISSGVTQNVWLSQQPLLTVDAQDDVALRERVSIVAYGIRSVMCAPLRVHGHGVGIVYVDSRAQSALFDMAHLDLLAAFCNQAAIAIDNARLFADLRRTIREISAMKAYMDDIFASIASGVVSADTRGAVTTFNRAAERIFGLAGDQALGQPYQAVLANLGDAELAEILRGAMMERRETLGHEVTRQLPQRGEVHLRLNVSPLRSDEGTGESLGVAMVVDDLTELRRSQRQAEEIQRLFGRYVHPAVVRQLLADPSAVNLGGETREISVVFADIRGYTPLAERLAPDALVRVLNAYLHVLTEAIWCE
ncbi:MAG TPA: PAS domain-containing protein, partial [Ktedonobacterales bacterium]|nr:PAS domain-containing protein [Ktedonobacterales bacterium]